ncbi:MAG: hypothetical protein F6K50_46195 [Moorea sp. SIO3I7]|uniref:hypothetical protein n=1 Tax=unclassified Moorena TaxID=2683338 RepID=UPI0013C09352|nr:MULTISPECIES: hypothetical protein [unclassified Moorena]NEO02483.1 hypothetical protein [Moorena sp. SIO3I7]NEO07312.1 hypothetical protein [Moorena sp. SIO3I8]NEO22266.1 hypothetical protein [Moorena sp. SIO4A5]NEQ58802.1 hypothetical protein [Moorena sp. SIO4A1]
MLSLPLLSFFCTGARFQPRISIFIILFSSIITPCSLFPIAYCLLPIAYCLLPIPDSRFPIPSNIDKEIV